MVWTKASGVLGVMVAIVSLGCEGKHPTKGPPSARPTVVQISAGNTSFYLVAPGKERRSGLYAVRLLEGLKTNPQLLFSSAADGKVATPKAGQSFLLIGRLPDVLKKWKVPAACTHYDFFKPEAGSIGGTRIDIPVKFVRWRGDTFETPSPCSVYFMVRLPALSAGKYQAKVTFADYVCWGDKSKIELPKKTSAAAPRFKPLTCEFEVKPAKATAAKTPSISWGKAVNGLQAGVSADAGYESGKPMQFAVRVRNKGDKPKRLYQAGTGRHLGVDSLLQWDLTFLSDDGSVDHRAHYRVMRYEPASPDVVLRPGQEEAVPIVVGGRRWEFWERIKRRDVTAPLPTLPPGKYTVAAVYEHPDHKQGSECPYWHGKITTGGVEIEIKPKAKANK